MHPRHYARFVAAIVGLAGGAVGCHDVVRVELDSSTVAGTYTLESVSGRYAPLSGQFILTADAQAVRRVRYPADTTQEYVISGAYVLHSADSIDFALHEKCGTADCIWNVHATRSGDRFTIQYPDPADGPMIVETYRRQ